MDMLNSKERINIGLRPEVQQELDKRQQTVNEVGQDEELSVQQEIKLHGDASVNGQDLDLMDESKGWYREAKHGREVQVEEIYVERIEKPVADAAKQEQGKENDNESAVTSVCGQSSNRLSVEISVGKSFMSSKT